ncbi:MAG: hypothetical protein LC730_05680 [Acidobacteria bacterium]|nr:hypothetical protein [Acidobacteriota bacterium]MCA1608933.1 hypothetical protein [Acidobacteriota bacterium]
MNFAKAEKYLLSLGNEVSAMKLGLETMQKLLAALDKPHEKYLKVQVAGTNGKGSVCAFLDAICRRAGIKTGVTTSPHLVSITERVRIDGCDISDEDFARHATLVRETSEMLVADGILETVPTYFEQVTAIALAAFAEAKIDLAILETGLGGRLDATTAAEAEIVAITRIDLDHQKYLGDTIAAIAAEKAAIIRPDTRVCVGRQPPEAFVIIAEKCADVGVRSKTLESARWEKPSPGKVDFIIGEFRAEEVMLSLEGDHQYENAALAVLIAEQLETYFPISKTDIINGLENARHHGRLEWLTDGKTEILLDGAHNRGGAGALARFLRVYLPNASIALVYGSMNDKDFKSILEILLPLITDLILTDIPVPRSMSSADMAKTLTTSANRKDRVFVVSEVRDALDSAIHLSENYPATRRSVILVTGSLYLVGEVKKLLLAEKDKTSVV